MFIVEALADFSAEIMKASASQAQEQEQQAVQQPEGDGEGDEIKARKRQRSEQHNRQLQQEASGDAAQKEGQQEQEQIKYTQFKAGEKVLVKETYENGWWMGHPIGRADLLGFFPSNYVKVGIKPPAPPPSAQSPPPQEEIPEFDPSEGNEWLKKEMQEVMPSGPVKSEYYQGIKGYKMVKIDEKNQNILKGNHVKFDVATGLAKVPIKDQAPAAKAVRQMGYYFDYHQWNEVMNKNGPQKGKPDPSKKKPKKLNLKMMDR